MSDVYKGHKPGSRKGEVHRIFDQKGVEEAMKYGVAKGLKEGTIKSWIGVWSGGKVRVKLNGATTSVKQASVPPVVNDIFASLFTHASRAAAEKAREGICKRAGTSAKAYHILEQSGKFAVVPAHYKPGGPIPQFQDGDWVMDTIVPNSLGQVKGAGPEQSMVKYQKPRHGFASDLVCIPNVYLYKVEAPKPATKARKKTDKRQNPSAKVAHKATKKKSKQG